MEKFKKKIEKLNLFNLIIYALFYTVVTKYTIAFGIFINYFKIKYLKFNFNIINLKPENEYVFREYGVYKFNFF